MSSNSVNCSCGNKDNKLRCSQECDRTKTYILKLTNEIKENKAKLEPYKNVLKWRIKFGKHEGKTFSELFVLERDYICFLIAKGYLDIKVQDTFKLSEKINGLERQLKYAKNPKED